MSEACPEFPEDFSHELEPNRLLADYLFDQFQDAAWRRTRDMGWTSARRGSPVGHLVDIGDSSVVTGSEKIVMKPAHPDDTRGDYAEVYAYVSQTPAARVLYYDDREIYLTGTYRVHLKSRNPENDEQWLVDDNGAHPIDISLEDIERDPGATAIQAILNAEHVYGVVSTYSPVFSRDQLPPETT